MVFTCINHLLLAQSVFARMLRDQQQTYNLKEIGSLSTSRQPRVTSSFLSPPSEGARHRVVVLLRGETFRHWSPTGFRSCSDDAIEMQWLAMGNLQKWVFEPLEEYYDVDLVVVDSANHSNCWLTNEYLDRLTENRQVRLLGWRALETKNQSDGVRQALDTLKNFTGQNVSQYDLVIILRHDARFDNTTEISKWKGSPSNFNFMSSCRFVGWKMARKDIGEHCVTDYLHVMPGRAFDVFDFIVGRYGSRCFENTDEQIQPGTCNDSGHCCFDAINNAMNYIGVNVSELFVDWRPNLYLMPEDVPYDAQGAPLARH